MFSERDWDTDVPRQEFTLSLGKHYEVKNKSKPNQEKAKTKKLLTKYHFKSKDNNKRKKIELNGAKPAVSVVEVQKVKKKRVLKSKTNKPKPANIGNEMTATSGLHIEKLLSQTNKNNISLNNIQKKKSTKVEIEKTNPRKRHFNENFQPEKDLVKTDVKKKKLKEGLKYKSEEEFLTNRSTQRKKEKFRKLIESNRTPILAKGNKLRQRMLERLKGAQFRYLNEKLYTSSGSDAQQLFKLKPDSFQTYHEGYQQQLKKWPVNPLHVITKKIKKMPDTYKVADMGCGEGMLAKLVCQTVRSFDLMSEAPHVEACNMSHTPLLTASMDVAVYCLSLMGTDLTQYLLEANRILKMKGCLLIAEVESRFDNAAQFAKDVEKLGFKLKELDKSHKVFLFMQFTKVKDPPVKKNNLPQLSLKPCLYKKR